MSTGARPDTWMPFYWGDYLRDTMHLRAEGHGAYMLLIGAYWANGGPLPDDDDAISAICRLEPKAWQRLKPTLAKFFQVGNGQWRHGRIDAELNRAMTISKERRNAGQRGGNRSAKARANPPANEQQKATPSQSQEDNQKADRPNLDAARDPRSNGHEPEPARPRQPPGRPSPAATAIAGIAAARSRPR